MTEQTVEYLRKAKAGDKQAAETLIKENSGLIWSVARRFFGRGTEADDLYQPVSYTHLTLPTKA